MSKLWLVEILWSVEMYYFLNAAGMFLLCVAMFGLGRLFENEKRKRNKKINKKGGEVLTINNKPNPKEVGFRIKSLRKELGLTMKEFGSKIDWKVKEGTISNWENGKNIPNVKRLKKIAEIGDVTVEYLLNGKTYIMNDKKLFSNDRNERFSNERKYYAVYPDCEKIDSGWSEEVNGEDKSYMAGHIVLHEEHGAYVPNEEGRKNGLSKCETIKLFERDELLKMLENGLEGIDITLCDGYTYIAHYYLNDDSEGEEKG